MREIEKELEELWFAERAEERAREIEESWHDEGFEDLHDEDFDDEDFEDLGDLEDPESNDE